MWVVSGVATGVLSALRPGSLFDRMAMGVALAGVSLPMFFTGALALALFTYQWPIFERSDYVPLTEDPVQWARTLVLPWVTLAFLYSALYARLTRAGMLETMSEDYIRTARAKGLRERKVVVRHGLRAALTPIITVFGMDLGPAARRRAHHRTGLLAPGSRRLRRRGDHRQRPAEHPRRHPARRVLHRHMQSAGGRSVRRRRPAGEALVTDSSEDKTETAGPAVSAPVAEPAAGPTEPRPRPPSSKCAT